MTTMTYSDLALSWNIDNKSDRRYHTITIAVVVLTLFVAIILSYIPVPQEERRAQRFIPPRVASFLLEKKKLEAKIEEPKPEPKPKPKPKPPPEPKNNVKKLQKEKPAQKPLTQNQKKAREKAAESGLLALSNELADLMDTDDISGIIGGALTASQTGAGTSATSRKNLAENSSKGSGGIVTRKISSTLSKTVVSTREISAVEQTLISQTQENNQSDAKSDAQKRKSGVRTEESVTLIFDRNKGKLYSLYNRARRKNPNLEGKLILDITIAASGLVTRITVVSSELDDKKLEASIVKRIKAFKFGKQEVDQVTVTYPIEFLPS